MRRFAIFFTAGFACPLFAATQPAQPPVHAALNAHLAAQHARFSRTPFVPVVPEKYRVQLIDLNADATPEALVLMLGRDWGGTGGQTMFLFLGTKKGFTFLSRMTGIHAPMQGSLCVLDSKTRGWRDLGVRVSGGGAKAKFVRMRFDGTRYPLNPYVQPPMKDWPRGQFVLIHGDATAKALVGGRSHYTGLLGKATRFQMGLHHENGKVTGNYFYEKYGTLILLEGEASGRTVKLREKNGGKVTATLTLQHAATGWTGQWRRADGRKQYPLRLQLVATEQARRHAGVHGSKVSTAYPRFTGVAGRRFNEAVARGFEKRFREQVGDFQKAFDELDSEPEAFGASFQNWTFEDRAVVRFFSPDLISIQGSVYTYTGGAHGNYGDFPVNFCLRNGAATEVNVADLFDARKKWRALLGRHLRRELIRQEAHYVVEGEVKEADLAKSENFTFSPAGIEFHFPPYEVGPYAQGAFHVTVPYSILRPVLRLDGPLARWQ